MLGPLDIHQHLLAHDIHHEIVRIRRAEPTAAQLPESLSIGPDRCVLAHLFEVEGAGDERFILALATADIAPSDPRLIVAIETFLSETAPSGSTLARRRSRRPARASVKVRPAGPELVSSHTDYLASHLAPLLLPADIVVVATPNLAELSMNVVYTATGDGGTALAIRASDLLDTSKARLLGPLGELATLVLDEPRVENRVTEPEPQLAAVGPASSAGAGATRHHGGLALRSNGAVWTPPES